MPPALRPTLRKQDARLNCLSESYLVCQDGSAREGGPKGKECSFNLMRIEVNLRISQR
jgi:hypothetical protein